MAGCLFRLGTMPKISPVTVENNIDNVTKVIGVVLWRGRAKLNMVVCQNPTQTRALGPVRVRVRTWSFCLGTGGTGPLPDRGQSTLLIQATDQVQARRPAYTCLHRGATTVDATR